MIIEKTIKYRKRLVITEKRLCDLERIVLKYCDKISYRGRTKGKSDIIFDGRDELLKYDNFKEGTLVGLEMCCKSENNDTSIAIEIVPSIRILDETVKCRYKFADKEKEQLFVNELITFFDKATEAQTSYILCKMITAVAIIVLVIFSIIWMKKTKMTQIIPHLLFWFSFSMCFIYTLSLTVTEKKSWENVFPPAIFPWGEEEIRYNKTKLLRQNLFWALIIPVIIAIVFGVIHL